jgi:transposase
MEAALPPLIRAYAGTGKKPYPYHPFLRSAWAKSFFKIDTNTELIRRLKTDSILRVLCGFEQVPGKSTFSRNFKELSETAIMSETLDTLVKEAHEGKVVYHESRDSTAIEAREKERKEGEKGRRRGVGGRKRGKNGLRKKKVP